MLVHTDLDFDWTIRIVGFIILNILLPASIAVNACLTTSKKQFFLPLAFIEAPYVNLIVAGTFGFLGMLTPFFYLPVYAMSRG